MNYNCDYESWWRDWGQYMDEVVKNPQLEEQFKFFGVKVFNKFKIKYDGPLFDEEGSLVDPCEL